VRGWPIVNMLAGLRTRVVSARRAIEIRGWMFQMVV
jgi:hypothetical protein